MPLGGELGKYVLMLNFGDTEISDGFREKYEPYEVYQIESSVLKLMYTFAGDNNIGIYIGADTPLDKSNIKVNGIDLK